jgi:hypothetical protein
MRRCSPAFQAAGTGWRTLPAGCAALTCGYENPTLRVISLLLIRMSYELRQARNGVSQSAQLKVESWLTPHLIYGFTDG